MSRIYLELFNISITASWLILAVLILRVILKKAPKWSTCLLWGIVAIRLLIPFNIESELSVIPSAKPVPVEITYMNTPVVNTGIVTVDNVINPVISQQFTPDVAASVNPLQVITNIASVVWLVGMIALLVYAAFSFIRLRKKVATSIEIHDRVYACDEIESPFILGVFRPQIYLPSGIDSLSYEYILSHEHAHLKRGDHFWKPLGFMLLAVYWFNPLCWVAYIMLCKDIELACDEKATFKMDSNSRADYCQSLLSCSVNRRIITACPVAFGEVGVKDRVKSVLNYKKPAFWIIIVAIIACCVVSVCFLTNPKNDKTDNPSEENRDFIEKWANAFTDRDGQLIAELSSEKVQESLLEHDLLVIEDDYYSFGYSSPWPMWEEGVDGYTIVYQDDINSSAEILYYAWTSDPHVSVWKENITFERKDGSFTVTSEELRYFDSISSGAEFDEAYPVINGTLIDYSANGMGEALIINSMLSSSTIYFDLSDPVKAARILLNLLDNENKVKIERLQYNMSADTINLKILFSEDGTERMITMVKLSEEHGIWIPQDANADTLQEASNAQTLIASADNNLKDGYETATLTYVDNSEVGRDNYTDNPWDSDEQRDELAQTAIKELYTLTGFQVEECVYTTDGRSKFIFGKSKDAIRKSTVFYSRDFGFTLFGESTPYIGFVNARRVHYSDVQQLDSPYNKAEFSGSGAIPAWFLTHSGVYQNQTLTGFDAFDLDDTVFTHIKMYFDGGYYIVVMDEGIESVSEVSGPYLYEDKAGQSESYFSVIEDDVYRNLIKEMLDSGVFPVSEGIQYDGQPYENYYCVMDIDDDGQDELLLNFSNGTSMAGTGYYIYDYNRTTGEIYFEHSGFPSMTIYDNGYIKEDASHNHGRSNLDNFWPYNLFEYNPETDRYEYVAFIDAWQSTFYGEGEPDPDFPKDKDGDGDGVVYYDMAEDYYNPTLIMDNTEYESWCEQYNKGKEKEIHWSLIITEEEYFKEYPSTAVG